MNNYNHEESDLSFSTPQKTFTMKQRATTQTFVGSDVDESEDYKHDIPPAPHDDIYSTLDVQDKEDLQTKAIRYFYIALKPFMFVLFMIFWILKEPFIRSVTFITIVVSTVIVDPLLYIWSILPNKQPASLERKKTLTTWFTVIVVLAGLVLCMYRLNPDTDHFRSYGDDDLARIHRRLDQLEKRWKEQTHILSQLENKQGAHEKTQKEIAKKLHAHEKEYQSVEKALAAQQTQLDRHDARVRERVKQLMSEHLPESLYVTTDKSGEHLALSPQFYAFLKSPEFIEQFVDANKEWIDQYLATRFFDRYKKDGALAGRETFMKLVTGDIVPHDSNEVSVNDLLDDKLKAYHQDVLNKADFALASRGGRILYSKTSATYEKLASWYGQVMRSVGLRVVGHPPEMVIIPQIHVGECWRMNGTEGQIGIALSEPITIQSATIEHPSEQVLLDEIQNAPKAIEFYGIKDGKESYAFLGQGVYDPSSQSTIQTFPLSSSDVFKSVLVKVKSNWGNNVYTDIYRIRIHGIPSQSD